MPRSSMDVVHAKADLNKASMILRYREEDFNRLFAVSVVLASRGGSADRHYVHTSVWTQHGWQQFTKDETITEREPDGYIPAKDVLDSSIPSIIHRLTEAFGGEKASD